MYVNGGSIIPFKVYLHTSIVLVSIWILVFFLSCSIESSVVVKMVTIISLVNSLSYNEYNN